MVRFVILTHDWPFLHWDFLVEVGDVLRAWRLLSEPVMDEDITAEPNGDHRLFYLDYEGPVSGGRGRVSCWDRGLCEWRADEAGLVEIEIHGMKLEARVVIRRASEGWVARFTLV